MREVIGKYLVVEPFGVGRGWHLRNKRDQDLGEIIWYVNWRQYVFRGMDHCDFSADCLRDIAAFLERQNAVQEPKL
jgi:hypothetical protein